MNERDLFREHPVEPERPVKSVSAEDTFPEDLPLAALAPALTEAAGRVWEAARRKGRGGRTVTLKLKTADFRVLTRRATPARPPASAEDLARTGIELLARVALPETTRYRLAGLGLSNFPDEENDESDRAQARLFDDSA